MVIQSTSRFAGRMNPALRNEGGDLLPGIEGRRLSTPGVVAFADETGEGGLDCVAAGTGGGDDGGDRDAGSAVEKLA